MGFANDFDPGESTFWRGISKSKWDKVFKNEPSENCGRQPLKNLKGYGLPQFLLGPFLNTLSQIILCFSANK